MRKSILPERKIGSDVSYKFLLYWTRTPFRTLVIYPFNSVSSTSPTTVCFFFKIFAYFLIPISLICSTTTASAVDTYSVCFVRRGKCGRLSVCGLSV